MFGEITVVFVVETGRALRCGVVVAGHIRVERAIWIMTLVALRGVDGLGENGAVTSQEFASRVLVPGGHRILGRIIGVGAKWWGFSYLEVVQLQEEEDEAGEQDEPHDSDATTDPIRFHV